MPRGSHLPWFPRPIDTGAILATAILFRGKPFFHPHHHRHHHPSRQFLPRETESNDRRRGLVVVRFAVFLRSGPKLGSGGGRGGRRRKDAEEEEGGRAGERA